MQNSVTGSYNYNVICKVCGWKLKAADARRRWDGLEPVCPDTCWEPRHSLDFFKQRDDFHKLPFTSLETDTNDIHRVFEPNYMPDAVTVSTTNTINYSTRFTANVAGHIDSVNVFHGHLPSVGKVENYGIISYMFSIWDVTAGGTKLWEGRFIPQPGVWNRFPVVPNVPVVAANEYAVAMMKFAGQPATYVSPAIVAPANTYFTHGSSYFSTTYIYPNTADVTATQMLDVSMRPT